jgi:hypothetical protein
MNYFLPIELKCIRYIDPRPKAEDGDLRGCYVNDGVRLYNKCPISIFNQLTNYRLIDHLDLECSGPNGKGFIMLPDWIAEIKHKKILIKIMELNIELPDFVTPELLNELKKQIGL